MSYEVQLTRRALEDSERLAASSGDDRREGVDLVTNRFFEALERLETFPLSCGFAYEDQHFPDEEVRHLLFKVFRRGRPYRALFTVQGDKVRVLTVRAPGERPVKPEDFD